MFSPQWQWYNGEMAVVQHSSDQSYIFFLNQTSTTSSQLELNRITYNNEGDVHLHLYAKTIIKEREQSVILYKGLRFALHFQGQFCSPVTITMEKLNLLLNKEMLSS